MSIAKSFMGALSGLVLLHCATPMYGDDEVVVPERPPVGTTLTPSKDNNIPGAPPPSGAEPRMDTPPTVPAGGACDLTKPFLGPIAVAGLATDAATPRLSHDELTVYFTTHVNDKARVARASRPSLSAPFGAKALIDVMSSSAKDNDPSISADGSTLWFSSERNGGNDRLFMATLLPGTTNFGAPKEVTSLTSDADEQHPYYRVAGGGELWFSSSKGGQWDIYVAKKNGNGFDAAKRVDELHDAEASRQPMITEDGLTVLFASERAGGQGQRDLWTTHRSAVTAKFGTPQVIAAVSSPADDYAGWLSPDGCRIYFSSDRETAKTHRLYTAARPRP